MHIPSSNHSQMKSLKCGKKASLNDLFVIIAKTIKQLGNSFYGKILDKNGNGQNPDKYCKTVMAKLKKALQLTNPHNFKCLEAISDNLYEVSTPKKSTTNIYPIIVR